MHNDKKGYKWVDLGNYSVLIAECLLYVILDITKTKKLFS